MPDPATPGRELRHLREVTEPTIPERQFCGGLLGRATSYRLMVTGDIGPRELGDIIRLLQVQREILQDSEPDAGGRRIEPPEPGGEREGRS